MNEIPEIVEELYYHLVHIPEREDRPKYLRDNELVASRLYAFYSGLRTGVKLSEALREEVRPYEE